VLCFTPDVHRYLELFALTHEISAAASVVMWRRTSMPRLGGVEDQSAKDMEALALIAREENALIRQARRRTEQAPEQDHG
jgi:hypothetical protein